ncbi:membrane protein [Marinithermofilum abyssi]|uniref:Membrane protein n=1 Tax=Marinithermofilum abyssi TaxID=1571185 RepID=A0A8J2VIG3_9BACL|nr:hemolysin family protein [Marinithermofilum abyssi]GGE15876.1 membrane protein [Marinithermofilum abyssi]
MDSALSIILNLLLVIFLVLLNGFFVAAEFAIVKVRATRLAQLGDKKAKIARKVVSDLDPYLSATQLGITLASLGLGWVGEPAIAHMLEPVFAYFGIPEVMVHTISFIIAFVVITFLHIVLGEMAPKSLAIRQAEGTTLWTAAPLYAFYHVFKPFIVLLNGSANLVLKWFGISETDHQQAHTEEEIRMLISQSHKSGIIDQTELALFDNVFEFSERMAREVMVPRVHMVSLYIDNSFEENWEIIKNARHTRFPLCGEDKDDIIGVVHIRDVYNCLLDEKKPSMQKLARPVISVPETMEIKDVMRNLQKNRSEMAIVVDEYGGTAGLITTEDIVEEVFGEIQDEFDNEQPHIQRIDSDEAIISPRLLIDEVNDYFQLNIEDPDNDTIGGWVFSQLEKVPEVHDQVTYDGWTFIVKEVDQRRITRLLITRDKETQEIASTETNIEEKRFL